MTGAPALPFLCNAAIAPAMQRGAYANDPVLAAAVARPNACRIALDWARVEPEPGRWDDAVLAAARARLTDAREGGLEPLLTLHRGHDPGWFRVEEGWLRGDAVQLFCRYVVKAREELGDLVTYYVTMESPTGLARAWVGDESQHRTTEPLSWWGATAASRRVLRALLHAHGAARRTLRAASPHHGPRRVAAPLVGIAHTLRSFAPRRASSPRDRAAAMAADYYWNRLPLRVLQDGRLHAPLGHGQSLLELERSLDFVGVVPAPRVAVSWASGADPPWSPRLPTAVGPDPDAATIRALLRRAGAGGGMVMLMPETVPPAAPDGVSTLRHVYLAAIAAARAEGIQVGGLLDALALL